MAKPVNPNAAAEAGNGNFEACRNSEGKLCFEDGILIAIALIYLVTELLGAFNLLIRPVVIGVWITALVTAGIALRQVRKRKRAKAEKVYPVDLKGKVLPKGIWLLPVALFLLLLGLMAACTVPYNWDSMTYHLTRIAHWIQDKNVDYFVTNCKRQNISPVLAEYLLLHLMLITGSDLFVNCLQWISGVICVIVLNRLMKRFGISAGIRGVALLAVATAPVFIGESLSTQVDLFAGMCLLLAIKKILDVSDHVRFGAVRRQNVLQIFLTALAIALCYLAKPNVCFTVCLLMLWLFYRCIKQGAVFWEILCYALIGAAVIILVPMPVFIRNISYAGDPFASQYMSGIGVGTILPTALLLNIYKNLASFTAFDSTRELWIKGGYFLADILHVDLNDPRITFGGNADFASSLSVSYNHDLAGGGVYIYILFSVSAIRCLLFVYDRIRRRTGKKESGFSNTGSGLSAMLLLQFFFMLGPIRWQPWVNRLLLPSFLLTALPLAKMLEDIYGRINIKACGTVGLLCLFAVLLRMAYFPVDFHEDYVKRNLSGEESRWQLYFAQRPINDYYEALCRAASGYERVGIYASGDSYEYPIWVWLKEASGGQCTIENIVPGTDTDGFVPECILVLNQECTQLEVNGTVYAAAPEEDASDGYGILYPAAD